MKKFNDPIENWMSRSDPTAGFSLKERFLWGIKNNPYTVHSWKEMLYWLLGFATLVSGAALYKWLNT